MRAAFSTRGAGLLVAAALLLAAVAAGCGGSEKAATGSAAATAASGQSAEQIVKESEAKMATVKSASFAVDAGLEIQGDVQKMTDPTAKALLSQGVTVHAEGKASSEPTLADMTMSLGIAGQTLEFGMKTTGKKAWIGYQGAWYKIDAKDSQALDEQALGKASLTEQLKTLGLDMSEWGMAYQLVGTEDLGGVQVYHVKATADPKKVAAALAKAAADPKLGKELQGAGSELGQLGQGMTPDPKQAAEVARSFKSAIGDYWIGVDDKYAYKTQVVVVMDMTGQKDNQGVSGLTVKGTMTQGDFDQPVKVTPPQGAKPFDDFLNQLFGGMFGGSDGLTL